VFFRGFFILACLIITKKEVNAMKRFVIALCLAIALSVIFIFPAFTQAQRVPPNIWQNADMTYSFMQVLSPNSIRVRNILLTEKDGSQYFYRQDLVLRSGSFVAVAGTLQREGTDQSSITIGSTWTNVFRRQFPPEDINGSLALQEVNLKIDDDFLHVKITTFGPINIEDAIYCFQARNFPENDSLSLYTGAYQNGDAFLNIHYPDKLNDPNPDVNPGTGNVKTYLNAVTVGGGSLEWKIPLEDFPVGLIDGKYVDAWTSIPPGPRVDSTPTTKGKRIVVP